MLEVYSHTMLGSALIYVYSAMNCRDDLGCVPLVSLYESVRKMARVILFGYYDESIHE